jgi:hypothetical protein
MWLPRARSWPHIVPPCSTEASWDWRLPTDTLAELAQPQPKVHRCRYLLLQAEFTPRPRSNSPGDTQTELKTVPCVVEGICTRFPALVRKHGQHQAEM